MKKYGFAIIGCGMISNFHAKAIESLENAKLVACYDVFKASAERLAEQTGCRAYDDLDAMLADPEVEIVTIGTDILNAHSPKESAPIESILHFTNILKAMLEMIAE